MKKKYLGRFGKVYQCWPKTHLVSFFLTSFSVSVFLPGGIRVLGVFFADQQTSEVVLKSDIVERCLQKIDSVLNVDKKPSSYLAFHVNKKTGNQACDLISFANGSATKGQKASTEIEETGSDFHWQIVTSNFLFDNPFVFESSEQTEQNIVKKMKIALKMIEQNLDTSNILFDNTYRSKTDEFLDVKLILKECKQSKTPKKGSKVSKDVDISEDEDDEKTVKEYNAEILIDPEFPKAAGNIFYDLLH